MKEQQKTIPWIKNSSEFPLTTQALSNPNGLLAASEDLDSKWLLDSYRLGVFPWYNMGEPVLWWSPSPRAVLYTQDLKISKSLRKSLAQCSKNDQRAIRINTAFERVMRACSKPRKNQGGTWISEKIIQAYTALHHDGLAHSVEHWHQEELVGGLYCVAIGGMVFGESMFACQTDASKIAFVYFVKWLKEQHVRLIDCQQASNHLKSFGAIEISRTLFENELKRSFQHPAPDWAPCELIWHDD